MMTLDDLLREHREDVEPLVSPEGRDKWSEQVSYLRLYIAHELIYMDVEARCAASKARIDAKKKGIDPDLAAERAENDERKRLITLFLLQS